MLSACNVAPSVINKEKLNNQSEVNKESSYISELCPDKTAGKGLSERLLIHAACMNTIKEQYPYFRLLSLSDVASAYVYANKNDYAQYLLRIIKPEILNFPSKSQADHLTSRLAILHAELGEIDTAIDLVKRVNGRRKTEWRSDIYSAIALYYWRNTDIVQFKKYLKYVKHPLSYATTISKVILLHYRNKVSNNDYMALIRSSDNRIRKVDLIQHKVRLYLAMALSCNKLNNKECTKQYFNKAKQIARNINPKNISLVRRKGQSSIFISRTYAFIGDLNSAEKISNKMKYREWRIHTLPNIAYNYQQYGEFKKVEKLLKTAWEKSKTLKDNVMRRKTSVQDRLLLNIIINHARMGNYNKAMPLIMYLHTRKQRTKVYLELSRVFSGIWLPFTWENVDFLSY